MSDKAENVAARLVRRIIDLPRATSSRSISRFSNDSGFQDCSPTTSPGSSRIFKAIYSYKANRPDELSFIEGECIRVTCSTRYGSGWCEGELNGRIGLFPLNHTEELAREEILLVFGANEIVCTDPRGLEHSMLGQGATATVSRVKIKPVKTKNNIGSGTFSRLSNGETLFALKKFHNGYGHSNGKFSKRLAIEKLKKEALHVNSLSHENIVRLMGLCLEKPYFGLILELCDGGSLRKLCVELDPKRSMPLKVLVNWARQIAAGMEYLARKGKVHRDLKADNVLVKQVACQCDFKVDYCWRCGGYGLNTLQLKIADFGVTRNIETSSVMSDAGTYAWWPPEAFMHQDYTEKSDVWSFGVVLWEILTRDLPYRGMIGIAIVFQVATNRLQLEINKHCPEKWKGIMQSCWDFDKEKRPTFKTLLEQFEKYAEEIRKKNVMMDPIAKEVEGIYGPFFENLQQEKAYKVLNEYYNQQTPLGLPVELPTRPNRPSSLQEKSVVNLTYCSIDELVKIPNHVKNERYGSCPNLNENEAEKTEKELQWILAVRNKSSEEIRDLLIQKLKQYH